MNIEGKIPPGPHVVGAILSAGPDLIAVYCGEGRYAVFNFVGQPVNSNVCGTWFDGKDWHAFSLPPGSWLDMNKQEKRSVNLDELTSHDSW